jgi:hypothetical protein
MRNGDANRAPGVYNVLYTQREKTVPSVRIGDGATSIGSNPILTALIDPMQARELRPFDEKRTKRFGDTRESVAVSFKRDARRMLSAAPGESLPKGTPAPGAYGNESRRSIAAKATPSLLRPDVSSFGLTERFPEARVPRRAAGDAGILLLSQVGFYWVFLLVFCSVTLSRVCQPLLAFAVKLSLLLSLLCPLPFFTLPYPTRWSKTTR